jgi:Uma2 family endonuclease
MKRALYEECGVASFWAVDPDEPSLRVWELVGGAYVERAYITGTAEARLELPFPLSIRAADLVLG